MQSFAVLRYIYFTKNTVKPWSLCCSLHSSAFWPAIITPLTNRVVPSEAKPGQDSLHPSQEVIDSQGGGEEFQDLAMPTQYA